MYPKNNLDHVKKESFKNSMQVAGFGGANKISKSGLAKCLDGLKNELTNPSGVTGLMARCIG